MGDENGFQRRVTVEDGCFFASFSWCATLVEIDTDAFRVDRKAGVSSGS